MYRKDLSHLSWEQVFERQKERQALVGEWLDGLELQPGDRVLDIGAGPGFVSLQVAQRVGEHGLVYAVDTSAEALAFLERRQHEQGISQIRRIVADATNMGAVGEPVKAVLVTMMLHHANVPAVLLGHVAGLMAAGGKMVVGEFHPDGPCTSGPPREHRIQPEQVTEWADVAGLTAPRYTRQSPEHYMVLLERTIRP